MLIRYHESECEVIGLDSLTVSGWLDRFQCISGKKKNHTPFVK